MRKMKKTGSYNCSSIMCLIVCGLYYACGNLDSGTTAPTPTPLSVDKLPLFTLNCSSLDNLWGTLDWTRSGFDVEHTKIEVVCLRGGEKRKYYGSYLRSVPAQATITPSITTNTIIHISSSMPNMCTAALWSSSVNDHNPGPPSTIVFGPSFTSCDLPTTTPTPTPLSVDKLPLFTLNCSSLDNLWGTLDWTRSGFDVEHTKIEVVCLRGGEKRKYYGSYLQSVPVHATITPSITPVNVIHISSSVPNMCTAALWSSSVNYHNPGPASTIVVGPSFTSCDLPITKPYSSPLLSSSPLPTVTGSNRAILGAAVSVGIILLLIILGVIMIISIVLVKQRRKIVLRPIVSFGNEVDNRNTQVEILQYPDTDDAQLYDDN